jgi:hypothetical protein
VFDPEEIFYRTELYFISYRRDSNFSFAARDKGLVHIFLLTAIGFPHGGSSTVYIYTQTIHRTTQNVQYVEQHKNFSRLWAVPLLCGLYTGICLTTEKKYGKTSVRVAEEYQLAQ